MKHVLIVVIAVLAFVSVACGKKGPPKPPEAFAPVAVRYFTATGKVDGVQLSWLAPDKTQKGGEVENLDRFLVYRGDVASDEAVDFDVIEEIVISPEEFAQNKDKPFTMMDKTVKPGAVYDYYIRAKNAGGTKGEVSPVMRVKFIGESSAIRVVPLAK